MTLLAPLYESFKLYRQNFLSILKMCLPVMLIHAACIAFVTLDNQFPTTEELTMSLLWTVVVGLIFPPIYMTLIGRYLEAHSENPTPGLKTLWSGIAQKWLAVVVVNLVGGLAILVGTMAFLLPGAWIAIKFILAPNLVVLRGLGPLKALSESFRLTQGHFWQFAVCITLSAVPFGVVSLLFDGLMPLPRPFAADLGINLLILVTATLPVAVTFSFYKHVEQAATKSADA
jgi:hypothetical protein